MRDVVIVDEATAEYNRKREANRLQKLDRKDREIKRRNDRKLKRGTRYE